MNTRNQARRKYVPDMRKFTVLCEQNYVRLLKLYPHAANQFSDSDKPSTAEDFSFSINQTLKFNISLKEQFKYTSTVEVSQVDARMPDWLKPTMEVRLYHDAQMAEVIKSQNISRIKPTYTYPNPKMMQSDEKYQINHFLMDWMELCLAKGEVPVKLIW